MRISGVHTGIRCSKQHILNGEVNRLKTGAFTFRFETLPPSCLSHLTLLVSHLSSHDK